MLSISFRLATRLLAMAGAGLLAACNGPAAPPGGSGTSAPAAPASPGSPFPVAPASPPRSGTAPAPAPAPAPPAAASTPSPAAPGTPSSAPPVPAAAAQAPMATPPAPRDWDEYKDRAVRRIVATAGEAGETFTGVLPEPLQSIPVLQVQLNRDGSVRNITVLRTPKFVPETVEMAKKAIRRAAPFGPVGTLPPPWQFTETFLYNNGLKFQLRSLVE